MSSIHQLISAELAQAEQFLPLEAREEYILVAAGKNPDDNKLAELRFLLNNDIQIEIWDAHELETAIAKAYHLDNQDIMESTGSFQHVGTGDEIVSRKVTPNFGDDKSTIHLVDRFLSEAIRMRASDIHVESYDTEFRIRFRIDGKLLAFEQPPIEKRQAIISRLKIMADMDIAEKRRPQDGRIRMSNSRKTVDIRVSTLPTDAGEKVVLRILDKSSLNLSLDSLGMAPEILQPFKRTLQQPHGMILVTGPTGSGKTTTLYAALNYVNTPEVNITAIEDPVEYSIDGINQTMVKTGIGLTFSNILRTVLRQDPDIIMLGEIRDSETAQIAARAALTGHLLLSTLHTNDAVSSIFRLIDMGVDPFLVASSLELVLAQRLVRRICPHCKEQDDSELGAEFVRSPGRHIPDERFKGVGCSRCYMTGYSGREAIVEHFLIDEEIAERISRGATIGELRRLSAERGHRSLFDAGVEKVKAGITTLAEVKSIAVAR